MSTPAPGPAPTWRLKLSEGATSLVRRPVLALVLLAGLALAIELAQATPEIVPGGHAIGEVVRNIAYGLIGALLFSWLVVEIPAQARRRSTYAALRMTFQVLLTVGPGLAEQYRTLAPGLTLPKPFDPWDQTSFTEVVDAIKKAGVMEFPPIRAGLLESSVMGIERSLADLAPSISYLDEEVAHALSTFPRQSGISMLQVQKSPSGGVLFHSDVHITWTLLERARELYRALIEAGAYEPDVFSAFAGPSGTDPVPRSVIDPAAP